MKKYFIAAAALMLVAGAVSAQTTPKKTDAPTMKTMKHTAKKPSGNTAAVNSGSATDASKTAAAAPKKKHAKKHKPANAAGK
jgi:hypothetical protein